MIYRSRSDRQTRRFAARLAKKILSQRPLRGARVIALTGDLGSGKTVFVRGFLRAASVRGRITSPTFVILKRYAITHPRYAFAYHADFYRLSGKKHLKPLAFKKILNDPKNILLIEWADRAKKSIPKNAARINFRHGRNENERILTIY